MTSRRLVLPALCVLGLAPMAGAQDTVAVSRLVTQYAAERGSTGAVSRLVSEYADLPSATVAVSRLVSEYVDVPAVTTALSRLVTEFAPEPLGTQAVSRLTTSWVGYKMPDAAKALRIASGLSSATSRDGQVLNVVIAGGSATVIDILDVYRVLAYALHPETLP